MTIFFLGAAGLAFMASCPLPKDAQPVIVSIEPGCSTGQVAVLLRDSGVIRNPLLFRGFARIMGVGTKIQSGDFQFEPGIFLWDVLKSLVEGRVIYYTLTVREGLAVEQIANLVEERGFGSEAAFLEAAADLTLLPSFVAREEVEGTKYPLEGYLFPDTYFIRKGASERDLVSMMLSRTNAVFDKRLRDLARENGLTPHQAATVASIVEREAQAADERPTIAAVYLNRLRIGMKLDADPTVMYALGKYRGGLLWKELEIDSPFNTYKNIGLPPGPISNFGKASLEAVLHPKVVDYLYFVSKNDGTHAFAETFSEHQRNVREYRGQ